MIEIVTPLYQALASLMLGLTLAAWPDRDQRLPAEERAGWHGVASAISATVACVCIAMAPRWGRLLLVVSSATLWISFLAIGLRVRSWHRPLSVRFQRQAIATLIVISVVMAAHLVLTSSLALRAFSQLSLTLVLLCWILYELRQVDRLKSSLRLDMMRISLVGMMLLSCFWAWLVLSGNHGTALQISSLFKEGYLSFAMRLFLVVMLAFALISANGYDLERMVALKASASDQKEKAEQLNEQLSQALAEKTKSGKPCRLPHARRTCP